MSTELEAHPLAKKVPEMSPDEYAELVEDIRKNGLKERIVLYQGMILDGRHRARALRELGIPLDDRVTRQYEPEKMGDPATFVVSRNIRRRHLIKAQRVAVVLDILGDRPSLRGRPPHRSRQKKGPTWPN
jgi:hypothetical protein